MAQNYLEGKRLYCESKSPEALRLFNIGIKTLNLNKSLEKKYLKKTSEVFLNAYKADSTFCDAMFFAGYSLRLMNDEYATVCYYMADSLSNNKSIEFKINLAAEAMKFGNNEGFQLARKKYIETIKYFPESPEGYYGLALTSTIFKDLEEGLENLNIAIKRYNELGLKINEDLFFLKGTLLTLNGNYLAGLEYLEKSSSFKDNENYKIYYSLCLLKTSEVKEDKIMRRKAKRVYNKIVDKNKIPEDIRLLLVF
ncbi:hypothetical protein GCM10011444_14620 [Winogradskyella haliclonae]|uniref:Tetratricopeptide repeat protein n=1 Tax=Winogradskyella haliclonae TaxID=2048558 RepID=A0ABQ2C060_9FLAO|nr:hypothetical protein GCM10011444_14620 [Winogradskyella haliclonae]